MIKKEIGAVYEGKSISCDLDACFTDVDLISLFNRLEKVKQILINMKKLKFQNKQIQLDDFKSHFDLLQQLDPIDFDYYKKAFESSSDYQERFKSLLVFDQHFTLINEENEEVVISSKSINEPVTAYRMFKSKLGYDKIDEELIHDDRAK